LDINNSKNLRPLHLLHQKLKKDLFINPCKNFDGQIKAQIKNQKNSRKSHDSVLIGEEHRAWDAYLLIISGRHVVSPSKKGIHSLQKCQALRKR